MKLVTDTARITAPATTENLGPTFNTLALALNMTDTVKAKAITGPSVVRQVSRGASVRPAILRLHGDDAADHPTVRALHYVLDEVGSPQFGVELAYEAGIPRHVGLGSKEAQVVIGFLLARAMLGEPDSLDWQVLARFASDFRLSPPRVAASLFGGLVLVLPEPRADESGPFLTPPLRFAVAPQVAPTVFVPDFTVTQSGDQMMPQAVQFRRNVRNASRAAALVPALTGANISGLGEDVWRQYLMSATADDIYQVHREPLSPASIQLVTWLRSYGLPAVLSGNGPAVVSLLPAPEEITDAARRSGWAIYNPGVLSTSVLSGSSAPTKW